METLDYRKAGISYAIGSFFNKGIGFLTIPIFTRLLSMADYGIVSTYNSWVSMVSVVIGMTLYMAIRQIFIDYPDKIDEFHFTVTIFITIVFGTVIIICTLIGIVLSSDLLLPVLCIIQSYAGALIENYSMYVMMKYRYKIRTVFMILPNLISIIVSMIVIKFLLIDRLYLGRVIPTAVITFAFGLIVIHSVFIKNRKFNLGLLKYGLAISVPLIAHGVALTILAQSDRTMITALVGSDKTGIYSVVYNFSMISTALTAALSGIWSPWFLARLKGHTDQDLKKVNKIMKVYISFMMVVMCGVILVAPEILKFLVSEPYWEGFSIIPPIVLANLVIFIYTFYIDVEYTHKRTKTIAINTMVAAASNIALNYIFIRIFGYKAAAYTTIMSYVISLIMHYNCSRKLEPFMPKLCEYAGDFMVVIVSSMVYYIAIDIWIVRWGFALIITFKFAIYFWKDFWRNMDKKEGRLNI